MTSLAQLIVAASFTVSSPYGLPDPDLCAPPAGSSWGTVESVREAPAAGVAAAQGGVTGSPP